MPRPNTKESAKPTVSIPKVKFVFKKPDFSKLKELNFFPILKIVGMILVIVASVALIDLAVQYLNNDYSVAVVDGTRISKAKWHDRLEKAYGAAVAQELIEDEILKIEARKADISVTEEEVDQKVEEIRVSIGGEELLQSALVANNITMEELREQIELDALYTKILTPTLDYDDEDLKEFFNQYSDVIFPEETEALEEGEKLDFSEKKDATEQVYIQQMVQTNKNTWLTGKMEEYKIQDNSSAKPKYGFLTTTVNVFKSLSESLKKSK